MDVTQIVVVAGIVLAVGAFVVWPMFAARQAQAVAANVIDDARIEARIGEYRAALRRRTVCDSCLFANVDGARFCAECGARLPVASGTGSA